MTRVWFDPGTQFIMMDGVSPKPARSLTATWDGFLLRANELTGRGIFALPVSELGDEFSSGFSDAESALAYLTKVFDQSFKVDGGTV